MITRGNNVNGDINQFLKNSSLFTGLDESALKDMSRYLRVVTFTNGTVIFKEGDTGDRMYILKKGEISALKEMGLVQRELRRMQPGEIFGEMALISEGKRTATLKAVSDVECIEMQKADFSKLLNENTLFAGFILRLITDRLRHSDEVAIHDILNAYQALIFSLAKLAESRDPETGAHLNRVRDYCALLTDLLAQHPHFQNLITSSFIESIYFVSPLHDIGKVAIPDRILLKKGKLTKKEFEIMKTHTQHGADTIKTVLQSSGQSAFKIAYNIVLYHHEMYNGNGYPLGLSGEDIPLEARIMALADVYDALLSSRPYKPPIGYNETRVIIQENAGIQFDPCITEVMIKNIEGFENIHMKYID